MGWLTDKDPEAREALENQRRAAFEERIVKRLLKAVNVGVHVGAARADAALMNGGLPLLTFDWFHSAWPRFPARLGAAKVAWTHEITCGQLFGAEFAKLPFFREYQLCVEQLDIDLRLTHFALCFNWAGIQAGGSAMVMHNCPICSASLRYADPDHRENRGTRIVRPYGKPATIYVIESLNDFVANLGTDWGTE